MSGSVFRHIDRTPPPERFARGWQCLDLSESFTRVPQAIEAFGTKLVVFRTVRGEGVALQAACPQHGR